MVHEPTQEEEALAAKLVGEALHGYDKLLPPADLELVRAILESELVATERGQRTLRACRADPALLRSDDIPTDGTASKTKPKKSSGTA